MTQLIPNEWWELNSTQRDILLVLAQTDDSPLGIEIHRSIRGTGEDTSKAVTYRNLSTLEEMGYIESSSGGGKELTNEGMRLVELGVLEPAQVIVGELRV